jgi:hypothetical protein
MNDMNRKMSLDIDVNGLEKVEELNSELEGIFDQPQQRIIFNREVHEVIINYTINNFSENEN